MKKMLLSMTAAAALAAAVTPAAAQAWRGHDGYEGGYAQRGDDRSYYRISSYEWRIRSAVEQGRISRGQAGQLMAELRQLQPLAWRVESGRAGDWERQQLARGLGHVQAGLNIYASQNDNRYAYGDRDGYGRGWRR